MAYTEEEQQHFSGLGLVPEVGSWHLVNVHRTLESEWTCAIAPGSVLQEHMVMCVSLPDSELPAGIFTGSLMPSVAFGAKAALLRV